MEYLLFKITSRVETSIWLVDTDGREEDGGVVRTFGNYIHVVLIREKISVASRYQAPTLLGKQDMNL